LSNLKASFATSAGNSIEMNDPLFWEKIQTQGGLTVEEKADPLLTERRLRRNARQSRDGSEVAFEVVKDADFSDVGPGSEEAESSGDEANPTGQEPAEGKRILSKQQRIGL
jgi:hypothetical protein